MTSKTTYLVQRRLDLLASPAFIASVVLLVVNDWYLKAYFHNWLTGKLSDFAGLAAVTLLTCAIFPTRRWLPAALVATSFVYWKSPYSEPAIDLANRLSPFVIGRTVDYSDLMAIPVIWVACFFAPRMEGLSNRVWMQHTFAALSLVAFTGTTIINTHAVRETVRLPLAASNETLKGVEGDLQRVLDALASRYKLDCSVCEPLTIGRLYKDRQLYEGGWPTGLSLMARLDQDTGEFFYDIRVADLNPSPLKPEDVNSLRDALDKELRSSYPGLAVQPATRHSRETVDVVAYKRKALTSYRDAENQMDYERATVLVKESAERFGLRRSDAFGYYYLGRLFGPNPYDWELIVSVGIADSPLIIVGIYRVGAKYGELQNILARDIEARFQAEFGKDRTRIR